MSRTYVTRAGSWLPRFPLVAAGPPGAASPGRSLASPPRPPLKGDAMLPPRASAPLAAAAGLMAALPAGALAAPTHHAQAHAAGGDATALIYPSIVQTRLVRAQTALDKAARYADIGQPAKAITSLTAAR